LNEFFFQCTNSFARILRKDRIFLYLRFYAENIAWDLNDGSSISFKLAANYFYNCEFLFLGIPRKVIFHWFFIEQLFRLTLCEFLPQNSQRYELTNKGSLLLSIFLLVLSTMTQQRITYVFKSYSVIVNICCIF